MAAEKLDVEESSVQLGDSVSEINLFTLHEERAGRLVMDPEYMFYVSDLDNFQLKSYKGKPRSSLVKPSRRN